MRRRLAHGRLRAKVAFLLIVVEVGIRRIPLPRLCSLLRVDLDLVGPVAPTRTVPMPWWTEDIYEVVEAMLERWPWDATCLRRSLVLGVLLRPLSPALRVGVRSGPGRFAAHAWLEADGASLEEGVEDLMVLEASS